MLVCLFACLKTVLAWASGGGDLFVWVRRLFICGRLNRKSLP